MTPELRDWYLGTLGIVQYRSRDLEVVELPFHVEVREQPAEVRAIPEERTAIAAEFPQDRLKAPVMDIVAAKTDIVADSGKTADLEVAPTSPMPVSPTEATEEEQVAPFRLWCWQPADELLVLNSVSPGASPLAEEMELLENLLKSIDRAGSSRQPPEFIDWPFPGQNRTDLAGARDMLSVFVDVRIRQRGVLRVLLLGDLAARLLLATEPAGDVPAIGLRELPGGATAAILPSLQDMLQQPHLKCGAWQALRELPST